MHVRCLETDLNVYYEFEDEGTKTRHTAPKYTVDKWRERYGMITAKLDSGKSTNKGVCEFDPDFTGFTFDPDN